MSIKSTQADKSTEEGSKGSRGTKGSDVMSMAPFLTSSSRSKPTTMEELLAANNYIIPSIRRGQEVHGKIISVSHSEILIDIGAKSEGIIFGRELSAVSDMLSTLSVGDEIEATVVHPENDAGQVVLSLKKLSGEKRWNELEEYRKNGEDIEVTALEVNRGGVICDYFGLRGFLPASQLSQAGTKLDDLIGKSLSARVIEVDRTTNRLILSQKQPAKKDLEALLKLLAKVKIGEKYEGVISAILPFGIFVEIQLEGSKGTDDLKGTKEGTRLEGLVHISEISWEKIEDPSGAFKVGDKVEVMVIAKDEVTGRLNLSLRQLAKDPFLAASEKFSKDQNVSGRVARVTPYGVFLTIDEPDSTSIEGMIHISKLPPNENYDIGKVIEAMVESVDTSARRLSLVPVVKAKPILYR